MYYSNYVYMLGFLCPEDLIDYLTSSHHFHTAVSSTIFTKIN